MKAVKVLLAIVAIILVLYFGTSWFLAEKLDGVVQEAFQEVGTEQLNTRVSLDSVSVSVPKARATLGGLRIANPDGFSNEPVFELGSISVDIDLRSIFEDVLVIEEITVRDPLVNFEMNEKGKSNLDVLQERMGGAGGAGGSDGSKLLIIDALDFRGGSINARAALRPEEELVFDFPQISLTGLGRPDGATADEIGAEITAILLERSMSAARKAGVERLVDAQKERLMEKGKEKLEEKLKDIFDRD